METFGRYSGISDVTDAQRLALDLTNYKPPLLVETTDNGTWKWLGGSTWVQTHSGGAALVSPRIGPGTNPHIIAKSNVSETNVTSHIPAGKSITYISVLCTPSVASAAAAVAVGAQALITQQSLKGIVCVDADSDAFALAATNSGAAIPDSLSDGQQFFEIPLGVWTTIPLTAALSKGTNGTGRLDYRCNSLVADMALDFQFICS